MPTEPPISRLAFGSCRKQYKPQPIWDAVAAQKPDVWVWTGDAVYVKRGPSPETLRAAHRDANADENYRAMVENVRHVEGTWDDHDYGPNDGGKHWAHKEVARQMFLDEALGAPADSPRRTQAGGLYSSRTYGAAARNVKLINLDTRFSRDDAVIPSPGASPHLFKPGYVAAALRLLCAITGYGADHDGDVLGEEQWAWLRRELTNSTAAAHLIVSSIQVLTTSPVVESWGHYPRSRRRLLELLRETRASGALLLSGDVHHAELMGVRGLSSAAPPTNARDASLEASGLLEVTSSGLTHSCGHSRVERFLCESFLAEFAAQRLEQPSPTNPIGSAFTGLNFGTASFGPGSGGEPRMAVFVHDVSGDVVLRHVLPLDIGPDAEAAGWDAALHLPTVYDAAAAWRLPLAIVVAAAVAVVAVLVPPLCGAALVAARRRAEQRRKRELGKVS